MKITFPPEHFSEAGTLAYSRQYEALPRVFPVVTYLLMLWCIVTHYVAYIHGASDPLLTDQIQNKFGAINFIDPWGDPKWKFLTTCFIHDPGMMLHLLFNMMWLYQLGPLMERGLGSMKFILFVVVTGYVSSALQTSIEGPGIGLSGVVYALAGFMWTAWPRWTGFLENFNGRTVKFMIFWQLICFAMAAFGDSNIGNTAHVSGMGFGALIGLWACWGNKRGAKWLLASVAVTAMGILVSFWSPWSEEYQMLQMSKQPKKNLNIYQLIKVRNWKMDRESLELDQ